MSYLDDLKKAAALMDKGVKLTPEEENPELMAEFVKGPYKDNGDGSFDCIFIHPIYGDMPFTASANDVEPHGRAAHAFILTQLSPSGGETQEENDG